MRFSGGDTFKNALNADEVGIFVRERQYETKDGTETGSGFGNDGGTPFTYGVWTGWRGGP